MSKFWAWIAVAVVLVLVGVAVYFAAVPAGREAWNTYQYGLHKADDATLYETRKKVEDSCRAMMASYEADRLTWEQYRNSDSAEQRGWAEQAKMRANRTAATYNEYVLKNSYVWEGNVPGDIDARLNYLQ